MEPFKRLIGIGFFLALLAALSPRGAFSAAPSEELIPDSISLSGFNVKTKQPSATPGQTQWVIDLSWEISAGTTMTTVQWMVSGENGSTFTTGGPITVLAPAKKISMKSSVPSTQNATVVASLVARNAVGSAAAKTVAMTLGGGGVGRLGPQSVFTNPLFAAVEFAFSNPNADANAFEASIRTPSGREVASMTLPREVVLGKFSGLPTGAYIFAITIKYSDGSTSSPVEQSFTVTESDAVPTGTPTPGPTIGIPPTLVPTASPTVSPDSSKDRRGRIGAPLIVARKGKTWAFCRIHRSLGKGKALVRVKQKNGKKLRLKTRKGATKKQYRTYVARLKLHPGAKFTAACQWLTNSQSILGATSRIYSSRK